MSYASLEVLFSPADFAALKGRDLSSAVAVVFDVLRATSSIVTALAHGAEAVIPVQEIEQANSLARAEPAYLLAGERHGLRLLAHQTGQRDFDLGNSPREFQPEIVAGRTIVMTTTNGTRALQACSHARAVLVGSFLNLTATARALSQAPAEQLLLVCGGTFEELAYEDVLGAGALAELLGERAPLSDSALIARQIWRGAEPDLLAALALSRNGRHLLGQPGLAQDVAYCAQIDCFPVVGRMRGERVTLCPGQDARAGRAESSGPGASLT